MNHDAHKTIHWSICPECQSVGKKTQKLSEKAKRLYQKELIKYEKSGKIGQPPFQPKRHRGMCNNCRGSGLLSSDYPTPIDTDNYPHVAIIGGGISGVALAVGCLHRGIPFTLYERDTSFDARAQGYGLTLQQASKSIEGFGILGFADEIRTTRHLAHNTEGKIIGEWGKKEKERESGKPRKQKNIHIARQGLRLELLAQLGGCPSVKWGHKLIDIVRNHDDESVDLTFEVDGKGIKEKAGLVVGADGIRSVVRKFIMDEEVAPLNYIGYMVILGICSFDEIENTHSSLLDRETVFQTVNGHERIYMMPYSHDAIMWQLSFPIAEHEARTLSAQGAEALKQEAIARTPWHDPIPQILRATPPSKITGYPVYDREMLSEKDFKNAGNATIIGDAAHPMSPFKGQGANRALIDALLLCREIYTGCGPGSEWRKIGIRKAVLEKFESEMIQQSASKVQASREAGRLLHSDAVLHDGDVPRGRGIRA